MIHVRLFDIARAVKGYVCRECEVVDEVVRRPTIELIAAVVDISGRERLLVRMNFSFAGVVVGRVMHERISDEQIFLRVVTRFTRDQVIDICADEVRPTRWRHGCTVHQQLGTLQKLMDGVEAVILMLAKWTSSVTVLIRGNVIVNANENYAGVFSQ